MIDERKEKADLKRRRAYERQRKLRIDGCVAALLSHRDGREYLYWLLEMGQIGHQPFTANALTTAFNCGSLNIGQQILAHIIEVAPDGYLKMLKEKQEEQDGGTSPNNGRDADPDADLDEPSSATAN